MLIWNIVYFVLCLLSWLLWLLWLLWSIVWKQFNVSLSQILGNVTITALAALDAFLCISTNAGLNLYWYKTSSVLMFNSWRVSDNKLVASYDKHWHHVCSCLYGFIYTEILIYVNAASINKNVYIEQASCFWVINILERTRFK